jgi:topoisomerase-4 subunit A
MKGHGIDADSIKFKEGDGPAWTEEVMSTDRLVIMSSDGRAFILAADRLPGGRGNGEPIRLSIELEDNVGIVAMFKFDPERKRVMASSSGYGFVVPETELESNRKAGKQVVNTGEGQLLVCAPVDGSPPRQG